MMTLRSMALDRWLLRRLIILWRVWAPRAARWRLVRKVWMAKVPVRSGRWVLVLWSPFMGLVPMGLLLHSHRSLHEIRMALHEIHEIRSCMVRATRLLQAQHSGQLNQIALTFLRVFSCRGRGAGKTKFKMKIFFLAPGGRSCLQSQARTRLK